VEVGIILGDVKASVPPREHLRNLLRQVEAAQRNGFTTICMGQHWLYGEYRWLQPIPTFARLAAEVTADTRLVPTVLVVPVQNPVILAEDLATLDIVTDGRLSIGVGIGYRQEEFRQLGVPFEERFKRFEESLQIMRALWTQDVVTYPGQFWQLEEATTHIRPIQTPHPPVWIGAQQDVGVRRAARLGDTWPIPPAMPLDEVRSRIALFQETRAELGLPPCERFPLRREVTVGKDREDALRRYEQRARGKYVAYAQRDRTWAGSAEQLSSSFAEQVSDHVIAGTAEECIAQLTAIARELPVGPLVVRPQWPDMEPDDVVAYLDELGREVVPAMKALP